MELEDKLLWQHLDHDPPNPSSVDVAAAIVAGRKRRRARAASGLVGVAVLATAAILAVPAGLRAFGDTGPNQVAIDPTTQPPEDLPVGPRPGGAGLDPTECTVHRLPTPSGVTMGITSAIDPTGRYVVGRTYRFIPNGIDEVPTIWHDGTLTPVPMEGADPNFYGVNAAGDAVGSSYVDDDKRAAWLYRAGTLVRIPGIDAEARAINAAGVIVGHVGERPAVWTSATAAPQLLSDKSGMAFGIDEDGTIIGTMKSGGAVVWYPDHSQHPLPPPAGVSLAEAYGLGGGWAIGHGTSDAGGRVGLRWNLRTGVATAHPTVPNARDATAAGSMVGYDDEGYALYATEAATRRLPPVSTPVQMADNIAVAVSEDGRTIAGQGVLNNADRTIVAVTWTCT